MNTSIAGQADRQFGFDVARDVGDEVALPALAQTTGNLPSQLCPDDLLNLLGRTADDSRADVMTK